MRTKKFQDERWEIRISSKSHNEFKIKIANKLAKRKMEFKKKGADGLATDLEELFFLQMNLF